MAAMAISDEDWDDDGEMNEIVEGEIETSDVCATEMILAALRGGLGNDTLFANSALDDVDDDDSSLIAA